jgi:hypothetical membrane protein
MNFDEIIQTDIKSSLTKSGTLLFMAGFMIFMGIMTSEMLYKAPYNTHDSYISELATVSAATNTLQKNAAHLFDITMIVTGIMVMAAGFYVQKVFKRYISTIPIALTGLGLIGVGVFPGNIAPWHIIFALVIFIAGGVAAIASFRIVKSPLRYFFILFGLTTLTFLFLNKYLSREFGVGGSERWIFYPIVFWLTGLGTYLLGLKDGSKNIISDKKPAE